MGKHNPNQSALQSRRTNPGIAVSASDKVFSVGHAALDSALARSAVRAAGTPRTSPLGFGAMSSVHTPSVERPAHRPGACISETSITGSRSGTSELAIHGAVDSSVRTASGATPKLRIWRELATPSTN